MTLPVRSLNRTFSILVLSLHCAFCDALLAAEKVDLKAAVSLAARTGATTARHLLDHKSVDIPPSNLSPEERNEEIERALARYQDVKNGYASVSTTTKTTQGALGGVIGGAILYGGPQSAVTIPLTLLGAASYGTMELANRKVEEVGRKQAGKLLAVIADELVAEAGANDIAELLTDPNRLEKTLTTSEKFLKDIKDRAEASNDNALVQVTANAIAARASELDKAALLQIAQTVSDVNKTKNEFSEFMIEARESTRRIEDRFTEHSKILEGLGQDLADLDKSVLELDNEVDALGRNQDLVADFMFSGLSPKEKVRALRAGLIDNRIVCPSDSSNCEPIEIKASMIDRYETEAKVQGNIQAAGKILKGINDVQTITANLGIELGPDGEKAIEIGNTALNAYVGFMAGDYLGAVSSITGLFGKKRDPDAERFKVMMAFLRQQFEIVNKKLDKVLENQQTILNAVGMVSERLQRVYEDIDGRLARMEYQQTTISGNLKKLIWDPWKNCHSVYIYALNPQADTGFVSHVDPNTLAFYSFDDMQAVISARATEAKHCMNTVTKALDNITSNRGLGNFLDVKLALDPSSLPAAETLTSALEKEANKWRSLEQVYRENQVLPASKIFLAYADRNQLSPETMFFLLASQINTVSDLADIRSLVEDGYQYRCETESANDQVVRGLICLQGVVQSQLAHNMSLAILNAEILLDAVKWMIVVAQVGDIYQKNPERFAASIDELGTIPSYNAGKELIYRLTDVVTLAIASQGRIYGDVTALAAAEDILAGRTNTYHRLALKHNFYLAENVATVLLHMKRNTWDLEKDITGPTFENRYAQAFLHARSDTENRFEPLYALFGRGHKFGLNESGNTALIVSVDGAGVPLRLPAPIHLTQGKLVYPPAYYALLQRRDLLIDRRLDYEFGNNERLAQSVLFN